MEGVVGRMAQGGYACSVDEALDAEVFDDGEHLVTVPRASVVWDSNAEPSAAARAQPLASALENGFMYHCHPDGTEVVEGDDGQTVTVHPTQVKLRGSILI